MGKVTGFLEFERLEEGYEPVPKRLKNWKEFVIGLSEEQSKVQGVRCMDCGTPPTTSRSSPAASAPLRARPPAR